MPLGKMNAIRNPGQNPQIFQPITREQGGFPIPPESPRLIKSFGGSLRRDRFRAKGLFGNTGWGTTQVFPSQKVPAQESPNQGYLSQEYLSQGYNQGYGGQIPVQPAWEEPRKGGIKRFISNFMAKWKK